MKTFRTAIAVILLALPMLTFAGQVNINTADAQTLASELNGVGLSKAKAIVEYRQHHQFLEHFRLNSAISLAAMSCRPA